MKAVICTQYGSPEVLKIQEVPIPDVKKNQILVRIVASAVNSGDIKVRGLTGKGIQKLIMRMVLGFSKPRRSILGTVFSGVVEAVGEKVSRFKVGDKVFGMTGLSFGTYAEYISVYENGNVMHMPAKATHEEAAAIVFGGQTAIYFLEKMGITEISYGKILIIGATGSVGIAAIQLAKFYGADITAVCSSKGEELVASLGITKIILYDREDFTTGTEKFDIIFDAVGVSNKKECKHLLKAKGVYKNVLSVYASETVYQLTLLKTLFETGAMKAVIDKTFPLEKIAEAHQYVETGRKKGNVILRISQ
jgi:NADPH:quinone reductase-like Zn-dependent oxidoreductase